MKRPTVAQVRKALKMADVQIARDSYGWFFDLGSGQKFRSEMSASVGAYAELVRKETVVRISLVPKKRRKGR